MRWLSLLRLLPTARRGLLAVAILVNAGIGVMPIAFIAFMGVLISRVPTTTDASTLAPLLLLAIGALVSQQVLGPFQAACGEAIAREVDGACLQRLMRTGFEKASIPTLERPGVLDRLGDLRSAFDRATPTPGEAAAAMLPLLARYTQLAGALALIAWSLHIWTALVIGATAVTIRFGQRGSLGRFATMWEGLAPYRRRTHYLRGLATGTEAAKEIRVLGLLTWISSRLSRAQEEYFATFWTSRRKLLFWPFVGLAAVGLIGAGVAFGDLAQDGRPLLDYAIAVQAILIPIRFGAYFPECDSQTQFGWHAYRALMDFETTAAEGRPASTGASMKTRVRVGIRFEGVAFGYSSAIFENLDLELPAGRSTALVGVNGAGKTTLVKLLAGFYAPDRGRITVDGHDLREIDHDDWRRQLAVIFQDFVRYELTAAENIALGEATDDGVRTAAARAGALSIVDDLPRGQDTPLFSKYPGGQDLSGGQWQRIALARAFYAAQRGASVLVLDEPTAKLDVRSEVEFYDNFLTRTRGLTSLIISHRFSSVRRADRIVVLADGRVAEAGTHKQLLAQDGHYAHMFRLQAQRFAA